MIRIDDADGISFIPYIKNEYGIRLAKGKDANSIISSFDSRSKEIVVLDNMVARYNIFAEETLSEYILYFLGINDNIVYRIINKITGQRLRKYIIKRTKLKRGMGMRTYIECESHRELLLKGLRQ